MSKEAVKKKTKKDSNGDYIALAKDLKEIVLGHNKRISEVGSLVKRIAQRMGL
jgi:hypothetical protein